MQLAITKIVLLRRSHEIVLAAERSCLYLLVYCLCWRLVASGCLVVLLALHTLILSQPGDATRMPVVYLGLERLPSLAILVLPAMRASLSCHPSQHITTNRYTERERRRASSGAGASTASSQLAIFVNHAEQARPTRQPVNIFPRRRSPFVTGS